MCENIEESSDLLSSQMNLFVFGDSHSVIWGGNNVAFGVSKTSKFANVNICHLGPALAFNLINADGIKLGKWGAGILSILSKEKNCRVQSCCVLERLTFELKL